MYQHKKNNARDKKPETVFLINTNFIKNYQYEDINNLIIDNKEIKDLIDKCTFSNFELENESSTLYKIISKLNQDKLKEIDKKIKVNESYF